jgi:hypothetical protein
MLHALLLAASLDFGPHAVGFETRFARDHSRPPLAEGAGRLVPVYIWYPASKGTAGPAMTRGDVIDLLGRYETEARTEATDRIGRERFAELLKGHGGSAERVAELAAIRGRARAKAPWLAGKHPTVFFLDHRSPATIATHGELLASHGYVVASTPMLGSWDVEYDNSVAGMETQVANVRVAIDELARTRSADVSRLALMGVGIAANICVVYHLRNAEIDAVISLDGGLRSPFEAGLTRRNPYFDPAALRAPILMVEAPFAAEDRTLLDDYRYMDRWTATFPSMKEFHFLDFGHLESVVPNVIGAAPEGVDAGFAWATRTIRAFLDTHLRGVSDAMSALAEAPPQVMQLSFERARRRPPNELELRRLIERRGIGAALALYDELKTADPRPFLPQTLLNVASFFAFREDADYAIRKGLFSIYAGSHPLSARAHFALANACFARKERDCAAAHYERASALIATDYDQSIDAALRARITRLSVERLAELRGPS